MQERVRDQVDRHPRVVATGVISGALVLSVVAVGLAIAVFIGAQQIGEASAVPSPSPNPSASQTTEASPSATSGEPNGTSPPLAFEAPNDILPPDSLVVVTVDALQLRAEPGLSAQVVGTAPIGEKFYALWGPVTRDGLDWYWLATNTIEAVLWAAAGSGGVPYLELVPPDCPTADPDLATLIDMTADWDRLACFGDHPLNVVGTYGCGGCGGTQAGTYEPFWLAAPVRTDYLWVESGVGGTFHLHVAPDSGLAFPPEGSIVRVTGHFNDPASATCAVSVFDGEQVRAVDPRTADLYCREQFVVDAFEIIGSDPAFP